VPALIRIQPPENGILCQSALRINSLYPQQDEHTMRQTEV